MHIIVLIINGNPTKVANSQERMHLIPLELSLWRHIDESDYRKKNCLPVEERAELCLATTFFKLQYNAIKVTCFNLKKHRT